MLMALPRVIPLLIGAMILALGLLIALSPKSFGQDQEMRPGVGGSGEHAFQLYCSNCHGDGGRGDGPMASDLSVPPADLTKLSARNGGVFPRERLQGIIDGREIVKNHGDRDMPVWGKWFKMEAEEDLGGAEGDEGTVHRRIMDLINFLETLQSP
jgi:mono/diheme cytochrome c family protein